MKILLCGPVSLKLVGDLVENGKTLPRGYIYPLAAYLARTFHNMGHHVSLVTSANHPSKEHYWKGERFEIFLASRRKHLAFILDQYGRERNEMVRYIHAARPDIVHAQWTYEFAHAAVDSGIPCLVTARDAPKRVAKLMRSPYRYYRARYAGRVLPQIKNLSAISDYVSQQIKTEYGLTQEISLVPNGLMRQLFTDKTTIRLQRRRQNFFSVSAWGDLKNIKTLLRAFGTLHQRHPNARISLVGPGLGKDEAANKWAVKHNLENGVEFVGLQPHPEMLNLLREKADCFVHATLEESFCMTVLEAMAQGIPVVALPDSGAVPWLLDYGNAGLIAASQQASDLADAMEQIYTDSAKADSLAQAGYSRALTEFTLESVARQYLEIYKNIIEDDEKVD